MRLPASIAAILVLARFAIGWGGEGHQSVALLAENRLTAKAQAEIHDLLGKGSDGEQADLSDGEVSDWPDQIKRRRRDTAAWHYINVPFGETAYDAVRDDPAGIHIVAMISKFEAILADRAKPKVERAEALKFLAHLVGDIHQPLHVIERNGDKGGNRRLVFFKERKTAAKLHTVWDTDLIRSYIAGRALWDYLEILDAGIAADEAKEWAAGTPTDWANESLKVATESVYRDVPADGPPPKIDQNYIDDRRAVVEQQLQRAGVRLATVLNRALAE